MKKIFLAIILMARLAEAQPSAFDDWWFALPSGTTYADMLLSRATNFSLSADVGFNITRQTGGTLNVTNNGYSFYVGGTHSNINGILPWATIMDTTKAYTNNWAVANGDSAALSSFTDYHTTYNDWGTSNYNVRPAVGNCIVQGSYTVNSWVMDAGANAYCQGGSKLVTVTSGGIFQTGGSSVLYGDDQNRSMRLAFGVNEGLLHILGTLSGGGNKFSYSTDSAIELLLGSGGITKSGAGMYRMTTYGNSSSSGPYLFSVYSSQTGPLTINEGIVRVESLHTNALGSGAATLVMNGGTLQLAGGANIDFARNTTVKSNSGISPSIFTNNTAGVTYTLGTLAITNCTLTVAGGTNVSSGTAGLTFSGATTLTGSPTFNVTTNGSAGTTLTLAGTISGAYSITKTGAGQLTLSGNNSYANTYVNAGTLSVQSNNALPSSYNLYVTNSAVANLGSITNAINKLFLGGAEQNTGTHGSSSSTATFQNDAYFTGSGVLNVTNGL